MALMADTLAWGGPLGGCHWGSAQVMQEPPIQMAQRQTVAQLQAVWEQVCALSARLLAAACAPPGSLDGWTPEASAAALAECDRLGQLLVEAGDAAQQRAMRIATSAVAGSGKGGATQQTTPHVEDIQDSLWGPVSCEAVLLALSDAYATCRILDAAAAAAKRGHGQKAAVEQQTWAAPDSFKRATTKCWVRPEHTLRVMAMVAKHLPLLVYGRKEGGPLAAAVAAVTDEVAPSRVQPDQLRAALLSVGPMATGDYANASSRITSVYFDSLGPLDTYHTRLAREDGAQLVRIRWYGDADPTPADAGEGVKVFVECKTHREGKNDPSTKDRAPLPLQHLPAFLSNQPLPGLTTDLPGDASERKRRRADFLLQIQHYLAGHTTKTPVGPPSGRGPRQQQEPVLRTEYRRAAFQRSDNNDVRISIDMKMVLACELEGRQGSQVSAWCRSPLASGAAVPLGPTAVRFPYAVLEVKLEDRGNQPEWVKDLLATGLVHEAGSFSKYIHGCVELFPTLVRAHPFWCLPAFPGPDAGSSKGGQQQPKLRTATPQEMSALVALQAAQKEAMAAQQQQQQQQQHPVQQQQPIQVLQLQQQQQQLQLLQSFMSLLLQQQAPAGQAALPQSGPLPSAYISNRQTDARLLLAAPGSREPSSAMTAFVQGGTCAAATSGGGIALPGRQQQEQQEGGGRGDDVVITVHPTMEPRTPELSSLHEAKAGCLGMWGSRKRRNTGGDKLELLSHTSAALKGQYAPPAAPPVLESSAKAASPAAANPPLLPISTVPETVPQAAAGMPPPGKVNKKGDAKTLFSAERTFLNWMSISALVMLTALSLMSVTDCPTTSWVQGWCPSAIGGAAIAPVGLLLMAYSLAIFRWRTTQILAGSKVRFDDQRGPILLVFVLVVVMFAAFGLAMYAGAKEAIARTL